jgi:hypothetical protein
MGDADEGARSCARGGRAPHRAPDASAAARGAPSRVEPPAARASFPADSVADVYGARGGGAAHAAAAAPNATDASLPPFVSFSPTPDEAVHLRKLWVRYRDDPNHNTPDKWTAWLPNADERNASGKRRAKRRELTE